MAGVQLEHVRRLPGGSLELFIAKVENYSMGSPVEFLLQCVECMRPLYPEDTLKLLFPTLNGLSIPLEKPVSYGAARAQLKLVLEKVLEGVRVAAGELKKFGLHSPRVGGASAAANSGLSIEEVQRAGKWQCRDPEVIHCGE